MLTLHIRTDYPKVHIHMRPSQLEVGSVPGELDVQIEGPEIEVDQRQPMAELGMVDLRFFQREIVQMSVAKALEGIGRVAAEGDRMMNQMQHQDVVVRLAKEQGLQKDIQVNVDAAPKNPPRIGFHYAVQVRYQPGLVNTRANLFPPQFDWQMGGVEIAAVGQNYDQQG